MIRTLISKLTTWTVIAFIYVVVGMMLVYSWIFGDKWWREPEDTETSFDY